MLLLEPNILIFINKFIPLISKIHLPLPHIIHRTISFQTVFDKLKVHYDSHQEANCGCCTWRSQTVKSWSAFLPHFKKTKHLNELSRSGGSCTQNFTSKYISQTAWIIHIFLWTSFLSHCVVSRPVEKLSSHFVYVCISREKISNWNGLIS